MTALELINAAYLKAGVPNPDSIRYITGLNALNYLLDSWSNDNLLVPALVNENFNLVIGQGSYTIGTDGNFNTTRPGLIENAYIRDGNIDYFLTEISSRDYGMIIAKNISARPEQFYFATTYPLAEFYFNYIPEKTYGFYIDSWKPISSIATITDAINISDGYSKALIFNLAVDLASDENFQMPPGVYHTADEAKSMLEKRHAQQIVLPETIFDRAITKGRGTKFSIYTGE